MSQTEIFATMGPACGSEEIMREMITNGMTGMRLNLSHTTLPKSAGYIDAYRNAAKTCGVQAKILMDMQGPELRIGELGKPLRLETNTDQTYLVEGSQGVLDETRWKTADGKKCHLRVPVPRAVLDAAEEGDELLLDDGKILVRVEEKAVLQEVGPLDGYLGMVGSTVVKKALRVAVIRGGMISGHKSIKICEKDVDMPVLTEHDLGNLRLAIQYGITGIMQPFVHDGDDLRKVRQMIQTQIDNPAVSALRLYAKIENRKGAENIESILPEADVIVIARGDLGNDMPLWELPGVQKKIEEACKKHKKPYVVVTQMLASMENNPVPTRAEVSDIFHAVYHGAWGVMITGETAVGKYPAEAVKYLAKTAEEGRKGITEE